MVGPEAPLVDGLVDRLARGGHPRLRALGRAAARIEGSKTYAKELMATAGVPTAGHVVLRDARRGARRAPAPARRTPLVLKADVLAAGKGVIIAADEREARAALDVFFAEKRFGETEVVLEEFLDGRGALAAGALRRRARRAAGAGAGLQARLRRRRGPEHRRHGQLLAGAGLRPPSPPSELAARSHQPIVDELRRRGTPFHGILYAGLMLTADGPRVLEFNCRFGDPETQAVLPRLRSDLLELLEAALAPGRPRGRGAGVVGATGP